MPKVTKEQLQNRIRGLEEENKNLKQSLEDKEKLFVEEKEGIKKQHEEVLQQKEVEYNTKISELENKIKELEEQNKEKQRQIDKRELKKLAEAYKEQEDEYKNNAEKWFKYVIGSFILLFVSVGFTIYIAKNEAWYDRIEFYLMNFIIITFLIFSLKQFSYFIKLRTDYANRKTLAQSYHNILSSSEDNELKPKFLEKAADVLCAKSDVKHESYTLPEKLLETLSEISKNLSKKI